MIYIVREEIMGKVLLVTFRDDEEVVFKNLINFFKKEGYINLIDLFPIQNVLKYGNLEIDPKMQTVIMKGSNIKLTNYEFEILYLLAKSPGQIFSKEQIYNHVWNMVSFRTENNVSSLVHRIRKKIEPDPSKPIYILTVWGVGYKFSNTLLEEK